MTSPDRRHFEIRGKILYAEHEEYGMVRILAARSLEDARAFLNDYYRAVRWDSDRTGTFEAFAR